MKRLRWLLSALLVAFSSWAQAQISEQGELAGQGEYIRALAEVDRLDKSGQLNALMEKVTRPASPSELKAYADWLKARIMQTDTREPMYYWGYSHLLRMAGINDASALMFVTAALMLQAETARCADVSATSGKQHIALLMRSELRANYWAQTTETRRQARQFALKEEERKRTGPATLWVCAGGMEEIKAALNDGASQSPAVSSREGSTKVVLSSSHNPRLLTESAFDKQRKNIRAEFEQYFSNERNMQLSNP